MRIFDIFDWKTRCFRIIKHPQGCLYLRTLNAFRLFFIILLGALSSFAKEDELLDDYHPMYSRYTWQEIVDADEKAKIFNLIYENCQSNLSKITTWKAQYELDTFSSPKEKISSQKASEVYADMTKGIVDFSIDFQEDRLSWKYTCIMTNTSDEVLKDIPNAIPSSKIENINDSLSFHAIYQPNLVYIRRSFKPFTGQLQSIPDYTLSEQNVIYGFSINDYPSSNYSQRSDPRYFFSPARGGDGKWSPYWSAFAGRSLALLGKSGEETKLRINDFFKVFQCITKDVVLYKISVMSEENVPFDEEIYSSSSGFNIINKTQFSSLNVPDISFVWQYSEERGIYIPNKYSVYHAPGGSIINYKLVNGKINSKLPRNAFSLSGLELKDKDVVLNYVEKMNYIFKNGKLVKLCAFGESPDPTVLYVKPGISFFRMLLMGAGVALIVLGIVMKIVHTG